MSGDVHYEPSWGQVPALLADLARPGELVVTMGAGDITVESRSACRRGSAG